MTILFQIGQIISGRLSNYRIIKSIQPAVWLVKNQAEHKVIIKSVENHSRVENERNVLQYFQHRSAHIRPLIDEIVEPSKPTTIVLKHLDDHLLNASISRALSLREIEIVSKGILRALSLLHEDGYVHTDNVFVNYAVSDSTQDTSEMRFLEVQLGDLGGAYPQDSKYANEGIPIGAPIWTSPEVIMETPWNTATDIWSFGTLVISLIYGGDFNLFRHKVVPYGHEEYNLEVLKKQFKYFGPFPGKYEEIASPETVRAFLYLMEVIPAAETTPFSRTTTKEVRQKDKEFIGKIMKMDWRDRPTAKELLQDEWFADCEEYT